MWVIIAISLAIHVFCLIAGHTFLSGESWPHEPVHAAIETSGGLIALLVVAVILISLQGREKGTSYNIWIAGALLGMGTLDIMHAMVLVGQTFVWLHSTASFVGGAMFVLVWLPQSAERRVQRWWPWAVFCSAVLFGVLSILFPDATPQMVIKTESGPVFTSWALGLNVVGGVLLFIAAGRLIQTYRRTRNVDDLLFCLHCGLFGAAAIMFEQSALWDVAWWGWHVLRLLAYAVALWFVLLTEIRARREHTALLAEQNIALEQRVAERTSELEEANDQAQAANRAKSEFLANMSHEIRTPLNAVIGLTEIVLGTELDSGQKDYLSTVMDSAEALLSVINDILDFSKIEARKLDLEAVRFNLHDVVGDTLRSLAVRAQHKDLELACFVDPALPSTLIGDPVRLRQVITNLVGNAIKFTHKGEVVVRVEPEGDSPTGADQQPTRRLYFSVRDTGIGIETEKLDRMFEAFSQADSSTSRNFGGTGLGLSISSVLVEMMGGKLGVESTIREGSTFHFTVTFGVAAPPLGPPDQHELSLEGLRVLIVDDNATNRTILQAVTAAKRMRPALAESMQEAFALLEDAVANQDPFRLVLSDVNMPDHDGFELAAMIRTDSRFANMKIVFLTSAGQTGDLRRCEELRVAARLMKPVKQSELFEVVVRALALSTEPLQIDVPQTRNVIHLPPQKILLVEDSLANQKVALAVLGEHSHSVIVANNGRQALDLLAGQEFDVVLMDVQMPEMDGFAATKQIRLMEQGSERHQPIIAMTAHAMQGDRDKCLAAGMDDYVSKPIRREDLFKALARAAGVTNGQQTPAPQQSNPQQSNSGVESTTVSRPTSASIDLSMLTSQLHGDSETLKAIVNEYAKEIRDNLQRLPKLIEDEDHADVRRIAHMMRGALRQLQASDALKIAAKLEDAASEGDLSNAVRLVSELTIANEQVLNELDGFAESN